jgi:hypothetical protein
MKKRAFTLLRRWDKSNPSLQGTLGEIDFSITGLASVVFVELVGKNFDLRGTAGTFAF